MQKNYIIQLLPDAVVNMTPGRSSSFEVTVNGTLVYSKLATGAFPQFPALAQQIADLARAGK